MTPENFVSAWVRKHRHERIDPEVVPSKRKLDHLRDEMTEKQNAVDFTVSQYVQATLAFGVEQTRSEYRTLANRNWKLIRAFGIRATRILVLFVAAALVLGVFQLKATDTANNAVSDIQHDRKHSIEEKCKSGKQFHERLQGIIAKLPEPKKAEAKATAGFTETLTSAVVPITEKQCEEALEQAGFPGKIEEKT